MTASKPERLDGRRTRWQGTTPEQRRAATEAARTEQRRRSARLRFHRALDDLWAIPDAKLELAIRLIELEIDQRNRAGIAS